MPDWLGLNENRKRHRESRIRTRVIDPVEIPLNVEVEPPENGTGGFAARRFGYGRLGYGRLGHWRLGYGGFEQYTPSPKDVGEIGKPWVMSRGWKGLGNSLRHMIDNGFPLPFACIQEHHFVP